MLSLGPSPRLLHSSPEVGSSHRRAEIAGEVVKGTLNSVPGHAIGISGDTERYGSGGGSVLVFDRSSESLHR
jgi:hypothetical protein